MILNEELQKTYAILDEIGSGGGGTVFKAYHKRLQKEVVLKKIHHNLVGGNIRAETDILKNLKSEYLPQVLDFFELDGDVYTVMDFIPGQSLKEHLKEGQKFKQSQVLVWLDQLCSAVEKLHEQKPPIIHGDIKPDNIMLTPENNICLIDFNISGDFDNADVAGFTQGYASPEQISNFKARKARLQAGKTAPTENREVSEVTEIAEESDTTEVADDSEATEVVADDPRPASGGMPVPEVRRIPVDARSDIYSIGATVYHLLTGEKPGVDFVKPVWEYPVKIEESFGYLIMKCLEREPEKRYQSVAELQKAVANVHKSGRQYRALLRRQMFVRIALAVGVLAFAGLAAAGRTRMRWEKQEKYLGIVEKAREARARGAYDDMQIYCEEALEFLPERGEAYLEILRALYQRREYEAAISFAENDIFNHLADSDCMGEIYSVYGNSFLELEEYEPAAEAFSNAIYYDNMNPGYYQDYAIALAMMGQMDEAVQKLEQAVQYGLGKDAVYYTQGEFEWSVGNAKEALECFQNCVAVTEDDYRKMRAYLMCSVIMSQQAQTKKSREDTIALLEEAVQNVAQEYTGALLEKLAQEYIDMGELTGKGNYDMKAIEIFQRIAGYGWATYTTYQNVAMLYQKNGFYQQGLEVLELMLEQFGENYNTYKRMAFMEAGRQAKLEVKDRDYSDFKEFCQNAEQLYEEQLSGNRTDVEMITLQNLYDQAVQGGWIER